MTLACKISMYLVQMVNVDSRWGRERSFQLYASMIILIGQLAAAWPFKMSRGNSTMPVKLFSPELHKCYFLHIHKQIHSKVPTLSYFVGPKRSSGNCYIRCFLIDNTALHVRDVTRWARLNSQYFWKWTNANPMKFFSRAATASKL